VICASEQRKEVRLFLFEIGERRNAERQKSEEFGLAYRILGQGSFGPDVLTPHQPAKPPHPFSLVLFFLSCSISLVLSRAVHLHVLIISCKCEDMKKIRELRGEKLEPLNRF
jgi:hypothetical protein